MMSRENDTNSRILKGNINIEKYLIELKYEDIPMDDEKADIVTSIPKSPS